MINKVISSLPFKGHSCGTLVDRIHNGRPILELFKFDTPPEVKPELVKFVNSIGKNKMNVIIPAKIVNDSVLKPLGLTARNFRDNVVVSCVKLKKHTQIKLSEATKPQVGDLSLNIIL